MRSLDPVALEDVGIQMVQLTENAGRALAWHVRDLADETVLVVAGNGANRGGVLVAPLHVSTAIVAVWTLLGVPTVPGSPPAADGA